jgi:hypothetical protein
MEAPFAIDGLTLQTDVSPAGWVVAAVRDFGDNNVGCLVPPVFAAYARLFHPAYRNVDDPATDGGYAEQEVTWSEIARANGRTAHPAMQWPSITGSWRFIYDDEQPGLWDRQPEQGTLPLAQTRRLLPVLAAHTTTPQRCWYAVWEGFGDLNLPVDDEEIPRVEMPGRSMLLLAGPLSAATTSLSSITWSDRRASLWWPEDRAWCVSTGVDVMETFVGGGEKCIAALVADDGLEAMRVGADQRLAWESDPINPVPTDRSRY